MNYSTIETMLNNKTDLVLEDYPRQQPNSNYTPAVGKPWYRTTFLPAQPQPTSIGRNGYDMLNGLFQIDIFTPRGTRQTFAHQLTDLLVGEFERGSIVVDSANVINIQRSWSETNKEEPSWYHTMIMVSWSSFDI